MELRISWNWLNFIGFVYAFSTQLYGLYIHGPKMIVFLTSWCGIIQCFTFLNLLTSKQSSSTNKLLISSWSLGWTVTIFFWAYVYPLTESQKLPPMPLYISSHGGINLLLAVRYLLSDVQVEGKDFKWPCIIVLVYFIGMILPLKFLGFTIYPHFMEKVIPTVALIIGSLFCLGICFYVGLLMKSVEKKKLY